MKYSVIIPAYNAERTLPRCLDSLCRQLRDDVELLLIDQAVGLCAKRGYQ